MATVTVPGVGGISYSFNTPDNTALAQAIATALVTASVGGTLNVQAYDGVMTPPTVPGVTNQLVVAPSTAGGIVYTPAGYTFVADGTGGGAFTVAGAQNFIGGSGPLTIFNAAVAGTVDSIAVGDGNDLMGLIPGSTYDAAGGNGNDTYNANGSGTVSSGAGNNLFFVGGAAGDANLVLSHGHDTVAVGAGAATVATYGNAPLIFGGPGSLEVFSNGSANETVVGSSGPETIFSATSGLYFLGTTTSEYVGNTSTSSTIVGTTGQETMFGGAYSNELVFNNTSTLLFVSSIFDSTTVVGGTNPSTLFGGAGSSITYFGPTGAIFAAAGGNETLNAVGSSGNNTMYAGATTVLGAPNTMLVGGSGNDTLVAGTGNDTMAGGAGNNLFIFIQGHAGGTDLISDFTSNDLLFLSGYGSAAGANALATATVSGGATTIALSDNTKITFQNVGAPSSIHTFST